MLSLANTPMMQQYREAKEAHPGMILLFRAGDFYELFYDDAEIAARVLGITLTSRDKQAPMAGFPHHALEVHLRKLLLSGHRVAICDQVEDASQAKGRLIRREVTRVVTPGTLTDDTLLDPKQSNHLVALAPTKGNRAVGLAWVELSTGLFQAADVPRDRLSDELDRLAPSELLIGEMAANAEAQTLIERLRESLGTLTVTHRPDWTFDPESARSALFKHFKISTLAGFGFEDEQPCLTAAGALLVYLHETLKSSLSHLRRLRPYSEEKYLFLDEVTRRSLELTRTLRDNDREGSLLSILDRTVTSMGARLLQNWLLSPLAERTAIVQRHEAVGELLDDHSLRSDMRNLLGDAFDLQRLTARVSTGRASPRDLTAISRTLSLMPQLKKRMSGRKSTLLRDLESRLEACPDLREALDTALIDDPPMSPREGGLIRRGFDPQLDEYHQLATTGKEWMARYQADEIRRTGIPSLKVNYNQNDGYYIEITNANATKVPPEYQRRKTLKNAERYTTPDLLTYAEKILTATESISQREYDLFVQLRDQVAAQTHRLLQTAETLATLDVLGSLSELAAERNYVRPEMVSETSLHIREGRHPVLDQTLPPGTFVPNDVKMSPSEGMFLLITGPNMGGKSVYLRQVALLTLLAHMGSFVPAKEARIGMTDRVFTRVGASDDMGRSRSTFMVEMTEAANILNNAKETSLVILDEIGRGTSTYDGVSLAWGITEFLHEKIRCRTLFATHYHELAELSDRLPRLRNFNVRVHDAGGEIVFLHKIVAGSSVQSYGIHVAQKAGVPDSVLQRARIVLAELEKQHGEMPAKPNAHLKKPKIVQTSLFAGMDDPILVALRETDLSRLSDTEIANLVRNWQRELNTPPKK
jgi:DNA mismatch repair protein MutS